MLYTRSPLVVCCKIRVVVLNTRSTLSSIQNTTNPWPTSAHRAGVLNYNYFDVFVTLFLWWKNCTPCVTVRHPLGDYSDDEKLYHFTKSTNCYPLSTCTHPSVTSWYFLKIPGPSLSEIVPDAWKSNIPVHNDIHVTSKRLGWFDYILLDINTNILESSLNNFRGGIHVMLIDWSFN